MSKVQVVVGGQYGSEGKGAVAGRLAQEANALFAVRVAGPNAGHTVYDEQRRKFVLQQLPVAAVTNPEAVLGIAAGSEIDIEILDREVRELEAAGFEIRNRLIVDSQATIITHDHSMREYGGGDSHGDAGLTRDIGSTGKGIGAARADRAMREAKLYGELQPIAGTHPGDVAKAASQYLRGDYTVLVEGTQGFGLGLHQGHYPFCTSSDCRAVDFLAMAGISPWAWYVDEFEVWVTARTYPIRVAGNSGPLARETSWARLHEVSDGYIPLEGERTTVTKKVRRVGEWDSSLVRQAVEANGGDPVVRLALTFLDYKFPRVDHMNGYVGLDAEMRDYITDIEVETSAKVQMVGIGPDAYFLKEQFAFASENEGVPV